METAEVDSRPEEAFFSKLNQQQGQRLRMIAIVLTVVIVTICVRALLVGDWFDIALAASALASLLVARQLVPEDKAGSVVSVALVALTLLLSLYMWLSQGLYSGVLIAFPALLVIAGVSASLRLFWTLLAIMLAVVTAISAASYLEYRTYEPAPMTLGRWLIVSSTLLISGATIAWLMHEMGSMQRSLRAEAKRLRCSQAKLTHLVGHDALTGLSNRKAFTNHVEQMIEQAHERQQTLALLYMDIDNFKTINDSLGHSAGDELIRSVAWRLRQAVRDADALSRQGGDEFVMVLSNIDDVQTAITVAQRMQEAVAQPFEISSKQLLTSLSVGIALFPSDGRDADTLVRKSEMAMFQAKKAGRNTHFVHRAELTPDSHERLNIEQALRQAIARNELALHYQPIISLKDNRLVGAEALLRWQHPEHGLLAPDRFMDVAEQSGLIVEIGEWVLNQACREAVRWQAEGLKRLSVSVNLSAVQVRRNNLESMVAAALTSSGLAPELLELELTESMLLEKSDAFLQLLRNLKQMGVTLAIDDFGTGYSNLSYLQRFQVDRLKVDKSFVNNLSNNEQNRAIVTAVIQMAHSLKLKVTAEGIEHQLVQGILTALGCDHAQGYLFSRPVDAGAFLNYARSHCSQA